MTGMRVVVLGPPGSGKATQCARLAAVLRVPYISTGKLLREAAREDSGVRAALRNAMEAGEHVADALVEPLLCERLSHDVHGGEFLLEGFPRSNGQLATLRDWLGSESVGVVVELAVSEATSIQRLSGRCLAHDHLMALAGRLVAYRRDTEPMLAELRSSETVMTVDAERRISEVTADLFGSFLAPWDCAPALVAR